jgi:transcriptional regulator with XRE-family HTH domain
MIRNARLEPATLESRRSPLAQARLKRRLPLREAAARASLTEEEVTWLEEGRVYRFRTPDDALLALLLYATALELDHREARELAGLPVPPRPFEANLRARLAVLGAVAVAAIALVIALALPGRDQERVRAEDATRVVAEAKLPKPWQIAVDVRNGSGDITYTRRIASRVGGLGYHVARVGRADRFDYPETAVYYELGGAPVAERLARELGVASKPLPGGDNPRRLVVVVGPPRGPG